MKTRPNFPNILLTSLSLLFPFHLYAADYLPEDIPIITIPTLADVEKFERCFEKYLSPEEDQKIFGDLEWFSSVFPAPKTPIDFESVEEFMSLESSENQNYYGIEPWKSEYQQFLYSAKIYRSIMKTPKIFSSLSFWNIPPTTLVDLLDNTQTSRLILGSNPAYPPTLTDAYMQQISKQLAEKSELLHLCLAGNPLTPTSLHHLNTTLKNTSSLRSLSLKGTQIHIGKRKVEEHTTHWLTFAKALPLAITLRTLTLSWCQLSTEILTLAEGLKGNKHLTLLNLSHNLITGTILFDFAEKLLENPCNLKTLILAGNPLITLWPDPKSPYTIGYICIAQLFKGAPLLSSLDISQTIHLQRSFPEHLHQDLKKGGKPQDYRCIDLYEKYKQLGEALKILPEDWTIVLDYKSEDRDNFLSKVVHNNAYKHLYLALNHPNIPLKDLTLGPLDVLHEHFSNLRTLTDSKNIKLRILETIPKIILWEELYFSTETPRQAIRDKYDELETNALLESLLEQINELNSMTTPHPDPKKRPEKPSLRHQETVITTTTTTTPPNKQSSTTRPVSTSRSPSASTKMRNFTESLNLLSTQFYSYVELALKEEEEKGQSLQSLLDEIPSLFTFDPKFKPTLIETETGKVTIKVETQTDIDLYEEITQAHRYFRNLGERKKLNVAFRSTPYHYVHYLLKYGDVISLDLSGKRDDDIKHKKPSDIYIYKLCHELKHQHHLQVLNLSQTNMGVDGISSVCQFLAESTALLHLDLSHTYRLGHKWETFRKFVKALRKNNSLISLHLEDCHLNTAFEQAFKTEQHLEIVNALSLTFQGDIKPLTTLNLSHNAFTHVSGQIIGHGLFQNLHIRNLNLSDALFLRSCNFQKSREMFTNFLSSLSVQQNLRILDLSRILDVGLTVKPDSILNDRPQIPSDEPIEGKIDVTLANKGAFLVGKAITCLPFLTHFKYCQNYLNDESITYILNGLISKAHLQSVNLSDNNLTNRSTNVLTIFDQEMKKTHDVFNLTY